MWIIGFDLSLSAPAAVALPRNWRPGDWGRVRTWALHPPAPKSDDLAGQIDRYEAIALWASRCVRDLGATARVYVENYGYAPNNANASRIMESGGVVKYLLYKHHKLTVTAVTSSGARKLTLGFNPRRPYYDPKVAVQDVVFNKLGAPKTWTEDECDAFIIAQYGLAQEGGRIFSLPPPEKIRKPAMNRRGGRAV